MYWQFPGTNVRILGSMHMLPASNSGLPGWAVEAFEWKPAGDYLLVVSELVPYKRIDAAVRVCTASGRKLKIAGEAQKIPKRCFKGLPLSIEHALINAR